LNNFQEALYNVTFEARNDAMNATDWVAYTANFEIVGRVTGLVIDDHQVVVPKLTSKDIDFRQIRTIYREKKNVKL
jgi:hypothetical protein